MENYVYYIDVKRGILSSVEQSKVSEDPRVMLDCTDIFISSIDMNGKIKLSDKSGIPLYCECQEDIYTYFDRFIEMIDKSQWQELNEWFFNSEYQEYFVTREPG